MKKNIGFLIFILVLVALILLTYKDYGVAWDEKIFFNTGKYFLAKLLDFFHIANNLDLQGYVPTPYHLAGHGILYDLLIVSSTILLRSFSFETLHLLKALFALPIFLFVYLIVRKLLNQRLALFAVVLLLFFPRFYADMFTNAIDIPTAVFFSLNIWFFIYYLKSKQSYLKDILFGLVLATAVTHRLVLFYLYGINFIFILAYLYFEKKLELRNFIIKQIVIFASLIFFLHLFHPLLLTKPITGFIDLINLTEKYPWNASVLFHGKWYQAGVNPLPWYYIPKSILITIPIVTLVLFFIGNVRLFQICLINKKNNFLKIVFFYLLSVFYLPFIITFILKPTLYDSWRHYLFLTIPMVIFATFGLDLILNLKSTPIKSGSKILKSAILVIIFASFIMTGREMIVLHPYEYMFYNSLTGGLKGAYGKYETDYWGLGYKDATLWFNKNINDSKKQYKILVEGDPLSSSYYFKPNMQLTINEAEADYIFTFTRWNFHVRHPGTTIYTVQREGVPLIFIKKTR